MAPPPAPFLDPTSGRWIFDSTVLNNFFEAGIAGHLVMCFAGRAVLAAEVAAEVDVRPIKGAYRLIRWFEEIDLQLNDIKVYAQLRLRWGSAPGKDGGEAASIVIAHNEQLTFVTDDGTAYRARVRWESAPHAPLLSS
jgi:hypothetical protein